jgi:hypothetical protein
MDRSAEVTLSEGQIPFRDIVPSSNFRTLNFAFSPFSHRYYKTPFPFFESFLIVLLNKQTFCMAVILFKQGCRRR